MFFSLKLINESGKGELDQLPAFLFFLIDFGDGKMMGRGLSVQKKAVVAVGNNNSSIAENTQLLVMKGNAGRLEDAVLIEMNLFIKTAVAADMDKPAFGIGDSWKWSGFLRS